MVYLHRIGAHILSTIHDSFPHLNIEQAFDIRFDCESSAPLRLCGEIFFKGASRYEKAALFPAERVVHGWTAPALPEMQDCISPASSRLAMSGTYRPDAKAQGEKSQVG